MSRPTDPDLVTNTGTRLTCSDCAKLTKRIEELELDNKQLKSECNSFEEYKKQYGALVQMLKEQLESKTVEELTRDISKLKLYPQTVGSQQKMNGERAHLTSSNQTELLPEEQPPVNLQPEDSAIDGEMALAVEGRMEKPTPATSTQATPPQVTPTQVTPSQGNTALAVGTTVAAAAPIPSPANRQVSCKGDQRTIISKKITDEMIMFIKGKVTRDWKDLAGNLRLKREVIEEVDVNFGHIGNIKEAVHQMLHKWRQSNGIHATTDILLEALEKIERKDLVDEFCDEFKLYSNSSESEKPYVEQNDCVVPETRPLQEQHQQSDKHQQSVHVQSNFETFFSDFMVDSSAKGKKLFRKDLNRLNNFEREETKNIATEMDWNSELTIKFDSEVNGNLKVSNVLDKWAGILLNQNPHMTKDEKRDKIQEMVRSLRRENDGREDVISEIRSHLLGGTVGTKAHPTTQYTDLSYIIKHKVASELNLLGESCCLVAEGLGIKSDSIRYLTGHRDCGQQVLRAWETKANATVGTLYKVLTQDEIQDACKAASILE